MLADSSPLISRNKASGKTVFLGAAWVNWVDKTGGDDPVKALDLVLKLVTAESDAINGRFCWIDQPLLAPIPSWEDPINARPWG